jgi:hypothetical protein
LVRPPGNGSKVTGPCHIGKRERRARRASNDMAIC